jgi:hypothetical protein
MKLGKMPIRYPCIIYSNVEHRFGECPKKIEVQGMFKTKHVGTNITTTPKSPKTDNVSVNVVVIISTCSQ